MSALKTLTRAKLDEWLTRELRLIPGCEECVLQIGYVLSDAAPDECNWSAQTALTLGETAVGVECARHAVSIVERAQQRFRVAD